MPGELHILLIEDDADDIEFLKDAFAEQNLKVKLDILTRGDQINKYLDSNPVLPQLIVMDLNLPKIHGRQVLGIIRENPSFDKVPIAVLTTSSLEEDITFCMENGADKYFTKPSSPAGFASVVRELEAMSGHR